MSSLSPNPHFRAGTLVSFQNLRKSPALNGRVGIVLRSPSRTALRFDQKEPRHIVYVQATDSDKRSIVRARYANLTRVEDSSLDCHSESSTAHLCSFPLKLNLLPVYAIPNLSVNPGYYAFGNTTPSYVLSGVAAEAESASVLLLAAGDLRSVLYSIARDDPGGRKAKTRYSFFVNDAQPAVIARNILTLWLILNGKVDVKVLFSIWFSLRLSSTAYIALCDAVYALLRPDSHHELQKLGIAFDKPSDWDAVRAVLSRWLTWQDDLKWSAVCDSREKYIERKTKTSVQEIARGTASAAMVKYDLLREAKFPAEAAKREFELYGCTGIVEFEEELLYTNPTMFLRSDKYDLHYGSNPYNAFPPFATSYHRTHPLRSKCVSELERWMIALISHAKNVFWNFSTADCMVLSINLSRRNPFDVVATSNVSDHVGLLPLLQALRGLVVPGGTLLTQTLRFLTYSGSVLDYILSNLFVPIELCEAVLGWRCLGYSGASDAEKGGVLFNMPSFTDLMIAKMAGTVGSRAELNLKWVPANAADVPVDCSEEMVFSKLFARVRPMHIPLSTLTDTSVYKATELWSYTHPQTLLPILVAAAGLEDFKPFCNAEADAIELQDMVRCLRDDRVQDLCIATVSVPTVALEHVSMDKRAAASEIRILLDGGKLCIPYTALHAEFDEATNSVCFSWIMLRRRLRAADAARLKVITEDIVAVDTSNVQVRSIDPNSVPEWLRPAGGRRKQQAFELKRKESIRSCEITVKILDDWRNVADGEFTVQGVVDDVSGSIKIGMGKNMKHAITINVPGPLCAEETLLGVQDGIVYRLCFTRGKHQLLSAMPGADSWLHDTHSWIPMRYAHDQLMVMVSGMQLSDEEKFVSRSRENALIPPLVELKENLMSFFQQRGRGYFYLSFAGESQSDAPDVQAVVVHHGFRRDHLSGMPAADISVCFLSRSNIRDVLPLVRAECEIRGVSTIVLKPDTLELMKNYWQVYGMRLKDGDNAGKAPLLNEIRKPSVRKHFHRTLVTPLFTPGMLDGIIKDNNDDTPENKKERGMKLVEAGDYTGAMMEFKRAILAVGIDRQPHSIDKMRRWLVGTCYLNIAHCSLQSGEEADAREVIVCCNAARKYLYVEDTDLLEKARHREKRALEILRDLKLKRSLGTNRGSASE